MIPHNLDGRDLPPDVRELAAGRDPLAILHRAVTGAAGAVPPPGPGTDRSHLPAAWGFLANAVAHFIETLSDDDLARVVRDLSQSAGAPMAAAHCRFQNEGH